MTVEAGATYAQVEHDPSLSALFRRNAESLGRKFGDLGRPSGSTDMGNVSLVVPSIHPFLSIESSPAVNHQPEFTAFAARPAADRALVDAAISMAWTAIDVASDEELCRSLIDRWQARGRAN
jgi:metal-dependent amidase/aminoacylase/carboxypeptidase family protein